MERRTVVLLSSLVAMLMLVGGSAAATPPGEVPVGADRTLRVMTRNVYFGADLGPVIDAAQNGDVADVLVAAAGAYGEAMASDFPFRAAAIADEIAATRPALIGIQEATTWRSGPLFDPADATGVDVDLVAMILDELRSRGLRYEAVTRIDGFDAELPLPVTGIMADVRLTIGDVLLRDRSLTAEDLRITAVTSGHYTARVPPLVLPPPPPPLPPLEPLAFPRQWIAADVVVRGVPARVITTHLESISGLVRTFQAAELLAGPAGTDLPTVVIGDLNSEVGDEVDGVPGLPDSALRLVGAGYDDLGPAGLTCCQDSDLRNPTSDLSSRIDLVLGRGGFGSSDGFVTGAQPIGPSGIGARYASDHAGVVVTVRLPRRPT